jgi:hypothetical protein
MLIDAPNPAIGPKVAITALFDATSGHLEPAVGVVGHDEPAAGRRQRDRRIELLESEGITHGVHAADGPGLLSRLA